MRQREWARGYLLMSPTLPVMLAMLIAPLAALVVMSFWTQHVLEIDRTPSLANYWHLIEPAGPDDQTAYWLGIPGEPENEIGLHSKLVMIDDRFLRIGSSNLNHRSQGLDTECDVAIEATRESTAPSL